MNIQNTFKRLKSVKQCQQCRVFNTRLTLKDGRRNFDSNQIKNFESANDRRIASLCFRITTQNLFFKVSI